MELPTTLLSHDFTPPETPPHYDWLVLDPLARRDPAVGLWTARVAHHWRDWGKLGQIDLIPLPRHRRRYLNWAGELSDQRGWVHPAGRGHVVAELWTSARIELTLTPTPMHPVDVGALRISLWPTGSRWRGVITPAG